MLPPFFQANVLLSWVWSTVAKTLAQAGGLGAAGVLAEHKLWVVVLSGAGASEGCYDLLMLWMFLGLKDREEDGRPENPA